MPTIRPSSALLIALVITIGFILPILGGCRMNGTPAGPDTGVDDRVPLYQPMDNLDNFLIQPVGPTYMFSTEGYSSICEEEFPKFSVMIYSPTEGVLSNVQDIVVKTLVDSQTVPNQSSPVTGAVEFAPGTALADGPHVASVQITIENNTYPPVMADWAFDVYTKPPEITKVIYSDSEKKFMVFFNRPVPKSQILDPGRWNINLTSMANLVEVQPGQMAAIIQAPQTFTDFKSSQVDLTLHFNGDNGVSDYLLVTGKISRKGDGGGGGGGGCPCSPVLQSDFEPLPQPLYSDWPNPHDFTEDDDNAWAYKLVVAQNHCPLAEEWDFSYATVEQLWPFIVTDPDCGYYNSSSNPHLGPVHYLNSGIFIVSPTDFTHTILYPHYNQTTFTMTLMADNDQDCITVFNYVVGTAAVQVHADTSEPELTYGPFVLTGWQAARELENIAADPGDAALYYGMISPPTLAAYINLLRTTWADRIFVMAGGADPGGNLQPVSPLELDIRQVPQPCPPLLTINPNFLIRLDHAPLGQPPNSTELGAERIFDWPDAYHYPHGFPNDDDAFNEEEFALWDVTTKFDNICDGQDISMRVRVTDHVGNWVRGGYVEDMQVGVPGVDENEVQVVSLDAVDEFFNFSWKYSGLAPETSGGGAASIIHLRDESGRVYLRYVATVRAINEPPDEIIGEATSTESANPGPGCITSNSLKFTLIDPEVNPALVNILIGLLGPPPDCGYFYFGQLVVQDTANEGIPNTIFVSSRDTAEWGGEKEDQTFIAANPDSGFDFLAFNERLTYGKRRGIGAHIAEPDPDMLNAPTWYNYERMIKTSGFEAVWVYLESKSLPLPVQSQADLIYIGSHGYANPSPHTPYPEICTFTSQGQNDPDFELPGFGTFNLDVDGNSFRNDFISEGWAQWELFKAQKYLQEGYTDPAWLILDSCSQLSTQPFIENPLTSPLDAWRDKLFSLEEGTPGSPPPLSSIAGYQDSASSVLDSQLNYASYFLKYCAADFSEFLQSGPTSNPEYYADFSYLNPIFNNKDNWLIDAWLCSHIKTLDGRLCHPGYARIVDMAAAIDSQHTWAVEDMHDGPYSWHEYYLRRAHFRINMF